MKTKIEDAVLIDIPKIVDPQGRGKLSFIEKDLTVLFFPKIILEHKSISSGKLAFKDKNIFARAAIFYKFYGYLSYLKLMHHIYLLKKKNMISWKQVYSKFSVGLDGIKKFKSA